MWSLYIVRFKTNISSRKQIFHKACSTLSWFEFEWFAVCRCDLNSEWVFWQVRGGRERQGAPHGRGRWSWCTSFARALLFATDAVSGTMTSSYTTCKLVNGLVSSGLIPERGSVLFSLWTKGTLFSHGWMGLHQFSISLGVSMLLMLVLMPSFLSCHVLILTGNISSHDCLLACLLYNLYC